MTNASAAFSRVISSTLSRPISRPIRERRIVTGLSAMTCDITRSPFSAPGSTVTRKSGPFVVSDVIWQTITEVWLVGKASVCTTTAGRGPCRNRPRRRLKSSPRHRASSASNSETASIHPRASCSLSGLRRGREREHLPLPDRSSNCASIGDNQTQRYVILRIALPVPRVGALSSSVPPVGDTLQFPDAPVTALTEATEQREPFSLATSRCGGERLQRLAGRDAPSRRGRAPGRLCLAAPISPSQPSRDCAPRPSS